MGRRLLLILVGANFLAQARHAPAEESGERGDELHNEQDMLLNDTMRYFASETPILRGAMAGEYARAKDGIAFGVISSADALETRLGLLRLWWMPGAVGCVSMDETVISALTRSRLPRGLDVCYTPDVLMRRHWYQKYSRRSRLALLPLLLLRRFPDKRWFAVGHDDTIWSPLAMSNWLGRLDYRDEVGASHPNGSRQGFPGAFGSPFPRRNALFCG